MIPAEALAIVAGIGLTPEQAAEVARAMEVALCASTKMLEERRRRDRERKRQAKPPRISAEIVSVPRIAEEFQAEVSPEVSPKDNNQTPILPPSGECSGRERKPARAEVERDFSEFYSGYPKRLNRKTAFVRYEAVRRKGFTHAEIMRGLEGWIAKWTAEGTEDQFKPAPDVWLNKEKFTDDTTARPRAGPLAPNVINAFQSRGHPNVQPSKSASHALDRLRNKIRGDDEGGAQELLA